MERPGGYQREEKQKLLKYLLIRFQKGTLTEKEHEVLKRLNAELTSNMKNSHRHLRKEKAGFDERKRTLRKSLSSEIGWEIGENREHAKGRPSARILVASLSAAAVVLLFISILFNYTDIRTSLADKGLLAQFVFEEYGTTAQADEIVLDDGTILYLNANTTVRFPKGGFKGKTREVWLDEGEAFFEVTRDENRPFMVHTADGLQTKVLGTSFNIKSYGQLKGKTITVATGLVEVTKEGLGEKFLLEPDSEVRYDRESGNMVKAKTDADIISSWREGKLVFKAADTEELVMKVKSRFGIDIQMEGDDGGNLLFDAVFDRNATVDQVLITFSELFQYNYEFNGTTARLWPDE